MASELKTYRLTIWIPCIVVAGFALLIAVMLAGEYHHRSHQVIDDSRIQLNESAYQLAHSLEYAYANDGKQHAQSTLSRFTLRENAVFSALVNANGVFEQSSRFAWHGQKIQQFLSPEETRLVTTAVSRKHHQTLYQDGIITTAIPINLQDQDNVIDTQQRPPSVLLVQSDINHRLARITTETLNNLLPLALFIIALALMLIWMIHRLAIRPLNVLHSLADKLKNGDYQLTNPLSGDTQQTQIAQTLVDAANSTATNISALHEKEQRLVTTLQSIGDAVIVTDTQGRITRINAVACKLTGWDEESAIGEELTKVFDIYQPDTMIKNPDPVQSVLSTGRIVQLANHTVLRSKQGEIFHISDTAAPIREHEDTPVTGVVLVFQNVSDQYALRQELRHSVDFLQSLLTVSPSMTYILDIHTDDTPMFTLNYVTDSVNEYTGLPASYWLENPQAWVQKIHPDDMTSVEKTLLDCLHSNKALTNEFRFQRADNSYIHVQDHLKTIRDENGQPKQIIGVILDISEYKGFMARSQLLGDILERSLNEIYIIDANTFKFIQVNEGARKNLGYSLSELLEMTPVDIKKQFTEAGMEDLLAPLRSGLQKRLELETIHYRKDGSTYDVSVDLQLDNEGDQPVFVAIADDITERKIAERQISFLAHHDALTHLPNRALLGDRIHQSLISAERYQQKLALLYLDLDRFKFINDSLGHAIGDALLIAVANRLIDHMREQDTVCRIGGDEFIILLPDTDADGAAHVAQKIIDTITRPFSINNNQLFVTVSIGISIYPDNGIDGETLNKHADTAMYRAKHAGRNQYQFFTQEMHSQIVYKLELEHALRSALDQQQLELVYQPQLDLQNLQITGSEALLRWHHPELGEVAPLEFIPIAEETGLINSIGVWVMRTAIQQCKTWVDQGHKDIVMAINLSAVQFNNPTLVHTIVGILEEYQLPSHNLELEITESVAMLDIDLTIRQLKALTATGIRVSLDDFGTGYSSLNYLKKFPIDTLKIDQGFVMDMLYDEDDEAIVDAVIKLARSLGLKTLAEGVETQAHYQALKSKGCDYAQGYLFSRPIKSSEMERFLSKPLILE